MSRRRGAIKDGVPASEIKDELARINDRRAELESVINGTTGHAVLLHPSMATHYRRQVANLALVLRSDENRAEAADLLRALIDRIDLKLHGLIATGPLSASLRA